MFQHGSDEVSQILHEVALNEERVFAEEYQLHLYEKPREPSGYPAAQGDESRNRKKNIGYNGVCTENTTAFKAFHDKDKLNDIRGIENGGNSRTDLWPESNQKLGAEIATQCESGLIDPEFFELCRGITDMEGSNTHNDFESNLSNVHFPSSQQNTHINVRGHACPECGIFFKTSQHLARHQRAHSGERPYHCAACEKRFSRKYHLNEHIRIHTGERPYQCTECKKTFSWKKNFNRHQKTHTVTF